MKRLLAWLRAIPWAHDRFFAYDKTEHLIWSYALVLTCLAAFGLGTVTTAMILTVKGAAVEYAEWQRIIAWIARVKAAPPPPELEGSKVGTVVEEIFDRPVLCDWPSWRDLLVNYLGGAVAWAMWRWL